jgi:FtsP/CotA-like multicopper oxidase with cupredoxin domain
VVAILTAGAVAASLLWPLPDAYAAPLAATDQPARRVIDVPIANGKATVAGGTIKVKQGDELELRWSSDRPMSLHLHGYDVEVKVAPPSPAVMSFRANLAGRFAVSEHRQAGREQAVLYLEVHP